MSERSPEILYAAEAEKALLGCLLADRDLMDDAVGQLAKEDFFVPAHQTVFAAMRALYLDARVIDYQTVLQKLIDWKEAEHIKWSEFSAELMVSYATSWNFSSYVAIVKDKAKRRNLKSVLGRVHRAIYEADSTDDLLDLAEREIFAVTHKAVTGRSWDAKRAVSDFREHLNQVRDGCTSSRIRTGIQGLDEVNGGFPKPGYVVIGGPKGGGKSAMMLTLMENWCRAGLGVGIFSIEMTVRAIIQRKVGSVAGMDTRVMNNPLPHEAVPHVENALQSIGSWNFHIDPTSRLTMADVRSQARKWAAKGVSVIELDYIQLVASTRQEDRRLQLVEISADLARLAKELDITIVCLAQIKQDAAERGNYRTSDLSDCKSIGDDARVVIMLEKVPPAAGQTHNIMAVPYIARVDKFSEGETHQCRLAFNKKFQRIS